MIKKIRKEKGFVIIIEGKVLKKRWSDFLSFFKGTKFIPTGLLRSYFLQDIDDPEIWRMVNIWKDKKSFLKAHSQSPAPNGAHIFHAFDSEATFTSSNLVDLK